jgi:hypothetical protein
VNTDRWFCGVFQSAPDLIRWLAGPDDGSLADQPDPAELDHLYRFSAPEIKAVSHRLDGVLWPLGSDTGSPELPVVLLEIQMRADIGFHHRLAAQPMTVARKSHDPPLTRPATAPPSLLGGSLLVSALAQFSLSADTPLRSFLEAVHWVSVDARGQQPQLDGLRQVRQEIFESHKSNVVGCCEPLPIVWVKHRGRCIAVSHVGRAKTSIP